MTLPRKEKKYCEMSPTEKYIRTKDMTPEERYTFHRKETSKYVIERQESAQKAQICKAIEKQVIETIEKEFESLFK
jgi:hypothetical protein